MKFTIEPAKGAQDFEAAAELFREYVGWLGVDYALRGVEAEIAGFPGFYRQPAGTLLLARSEEDGVLGCIGVRPLPKEGACEIKRLFVRDAARGLGLGRALTVRSLAFAEAAGYGEVFCDTLPRLAGAVAIFRSLGFELTASYDSNPVPEALFFRKVLR